jgi:hypothetical protein
MIHEEDRKGLAITGLDDAKAMLALAEARDAIAAGSPDKILLVASSYDEKTLVSELTATLFMSNNQLTIAQEAPCVKHLHLKGSLASELSGASRTCEWP